MPSIFSTLLRSHPAALGPNCPFGGETTMFISKFRGWGRPALGVSLSALLIIPSPAFSQPNDDHHRTDTPIVPRHRPDWREPLV